MKIPEKSRLPGGQKPIHRINFRLVNLITLSVFILVGLWSYGELPEKVVSHWDYHGSADGYLPRLWGAFLLPIVASVMLLLLVLLPRIDPRKANIESFRQYFERFIFNLLMFLFCINALSLWWNVSGEFDINRFIAPAFAILLWQVGSLIAKAKSNWFIGIRTPWTLSSDEVWRQTHVLGAYLFKSAGGVAALGIFFPGQAMWFLLIPLIPATILPIVMSYVYYARLK